MKANERIIHTNANRAIMQESVLEATRAQARAVEPQERHRRLLDIIGSLGRKVGMPGKTTARSILGFVGSMLDDAVQHLWSMPIERPTEPLDMPHSRWNRDREHLSP